MNEVREGRTDRAKTLSDPQRRVLQSLRQHPGYEVLLDVMEDACIEQETILINADAADDARVLAEHKLAKAMWQFFVRVQKRVLGEIGELQPDLPLLTREEQRMEDQAREIANILDPLQPANFVDADLKPAE